MLSSKLTTTLLFSRFSIELSGRKLANQAEGRRINTCAQRGGGVSIRVAIASDAPADDLDVIAVCHVYEV